MVLCNAPTFQQVERIAEVFHVEHATFWDLYEKSRLLYDRCDLTPREYWSRFAEDAQTVLADATIERLQAWDIEMWSSLEPSMLRWAVSLKTHGYKTGLLSNLHQKFARELRTNATWLGNFDCQIFSSEVRLAKPDPAIFQLCLHSLRVNAQDVLFVDDRQSNIDVARNEGISAICFRSVEQLRTELRAMGVDVLP